jgi:ATP-dependent protease ClpP protease subunit
MIKEDEEEDQTALTIEEVSKSSPKEIIVDEDEYEIDDNIRSGVDILLPNELSSKEKNDLYIELKKKIKINVDVIFVRGLNAKTKNIEDILIFIRSRGLRLTKDMTIMDLINFVKKLPSEK